MLIVLESVGSVFDTKQGIIYPQKEDGSYDKDFSISIDEEEVSLDWWDSLSPQDFNVVKYGVSSETHSNL
tara:strand:+ start:54 stop:263 length:210 start_codon:yes stop_codon:yes gene_type:complete